MMEQPGEPSSSPGTTVSAAVLHLRDTWVRRLIDLSRNNRLIYHRELKNGTFALGDLHDKSVGRLIAGALCPVADFQASELSAKDRAKVREIRLRAKANEEERGLATLFCALGFASWPAPDGGRPANAPMFLLPVGIVNNERTGELALRASGDLAVNQVLLEKINDELHVQIDADDVILEDEEPDLFAAFRTLSEILGRIVRVSVATTCVLSNFDFQKMAMVEDLRKNGDLLAENDLVSAISGDEAARKSIAESQRLISPLELDKIPPADELFVLDADSSQQCVIHSFLRHPAHGAIKGPPGTGKSQTIANLIAALIGNGRRVLFVAEKRAALEVVQKRLAQVGLGHLVLDLHGGDVKRRTIYERLRVSDSAARNSAAVNGEHLDDVISTLRTRLNAYAVAVNLVRGVCGHSAYELFSALARLRDVKTRTRWKGGLVGEFTVDRYREARDLVMEISDSPQLFLREPDVPWSSADFETNEQAAHALVEVDTLQTLLETLQAQCTSIFLRDAELTPRTLSSIRDAVEHLQVFSRSIVAFGPEIFDDNVSHLASILQPAKRGMLYHLFALAGSEYRAVWRNMKRRCRADVRKPGDVVELLCLLAEQPASWRAPSLARAASAESVSLLVETYESVQSTVARLAVMLGHQLCDEVGALSDQLIKLQWASRSAYLSASLRTKERRLRELGAAAFLRELSGDKPNASDWVRMFEKAWFQSQLDHLFATDPVLSTFKGATHRVYVDKFRRLDSARLAQSAVRVRRAAAENYINALNANRLQYTTVRLELEKKSRHMPVRKLVASAPDVLMAITPCIMASPLSVSQLLPAQVLFDVVIFDEASQVLPEDAVPAIIRGKHTVVAGDQRQLPPTTFFALTDRDEEEEESDSAASGMESILDLMSGFVEPRPLEWHYRSRDETLIGFSNHYVYEDRLLTFPGVGGRDPAVQHVYVTPVLADGQELSSSAEVKRVVELIIEHAETRPRESLGVIAMGIKHARRIDEYLQNERRLRPDLDDFFSENRLESFFVKNLERVQGDERDAIILSIGYGPDRSGKMVYRFGPLLFSGGERRLNVAVTRAKNRITVVSSFRHAELDPQRLRSLGSNLLGRYIQYAESNGTNLGREGPVMGAEINAFEADIAEALKAEGLDLVPQYGVSNYRIDFAVRHPAKPGRFLLAVECDGASYHGSPTARDRDRLRQQHLEALGWRFHRIWSTDWFHNRAEEIDRAKAAYAAALAADSLVPSLREPSVPEPKQAIQQAAIRGARPKIQRRPAVSDYSETELHKIIGWINSDGLLRTDQEIIQEAARQMGFRRMGKRIVETLQLAIDSLRRSS
ncbi:DUF4011 domain-containing protein [bacterium]|nr:MAG: DUF4011 domain-containing protein [bacterium]